MQLTDLHQGQHVVWLQNQRWGQPPRRRIGIVAELTQTRVIIRTPTLDGRVIRRSVKPERLLMVVNNGNAKP